MSSAPNQSRSDHRGSGSILARSGQGPTTHGDNVLCPLVVCEEAAFALLGTFLYRGNFRPIESILHTT